MPEHWVGYELHITHSTMAFCSGVLWIKQQNDRTVGLSACCGYSVCLWACGFLCAADGGANIGQEAAVIHCGVSVMTRCRGCICFCDGGVGAFTVDVAITGALRELGTSWAVCWACVVENSVHLVRALSSLLIGRKQLQQEDWGSLP